MVVAEAVVAALIAVEFRGATGGAVMPKGPAIAVLFFTCLFVSGFAWSWGPLGWLVRFLLNGDRNRVRATTGVRDRTRQGLELGYVSALGSSGRV